MISKQEIIDQAFKLGFTDIGFTTAEPFEQQRTILHTLKEDYAWIYEKGILLEDGIDPHQSMAFSLPWIKYRVITTNIKKREKRTMVKRCCWGTFPIRSAMPKLSIY